MPEVQAHAERLTEALAGRELLKFELLNFASLKTFNPPPDGATGSICIRVSRRGKFLIIEFDNGHRHLLHLMQGGRLRPDAKRSRKPKFGLARWTLTSAGVGSDDDDQAWLFTEAGTERKAGIWVVEGDPLTQDPLAELGPEAAELSVHDLAMTLSGQSRRLHGVLRDQRLLAGLGRMLANEICYRAGLSPFANTSKLNEDEVERLHQALTESVADALAHERTLDDIGKSADRPSKVHNRADEPCTGCDDTVRMVEYRNYTVYYCPAEQTDGKILADNTTSKFLK